RLVVSCFKTAHSFADAGIQVPCSLVRNIKVALHLLRRNPLLCVCHQCNRKQPFFDGQVAVVEYGAGSCGELMLAGRLKGLVKEAQRTFLYLASLPIFSIGARLVFRDVIPAAHKTPDALWPAQMFEVIESRFLA